MTDKSLRQIATLAALAAAAALSGCDGLGDSDLSVDFDWDGNAIETDVPGVPLADLDFSGEAPTAIVLAGPDNVVVTTGEAFGIDVSGPQAVTDLLRFARQDGSLVVHRQDGSSSSGRATANITIPSANTLSVLGSGNLTADTVRGDAALVVLGSGDIAVRSVSADALNVTIPGSGNITASGTSDRLTLKILGTGTGDLADFQTAMAEVDIVGSGNATFRSDGPIEATLVGSGDVRVIGDAQCEAQTMGSGRLICGTR